MEDRLNEPKTMPARGDARPMHPALADISLVIFDLDGTLIDSVPDLAAALDAALAERELPPAGVDRVRDWVGNGSNKLVERALAHARDISLDALDAADVATAHARFLAHYAQAPCVRTRLYDGARACLETLQLRGITCALVTNKPACFLPVILEHFALTSFFAVTLGGDSLDEKKPRPAPLLHACARTGVAPSRALMVGDSRHDVQAGKAAGLTTLAVTYGYNHGQPIAHSQPDHLIDSLTMLAGDHALPI
jgi:2-phosphoglycolate phosphatase, prokaryotic